MPPLTLAAIYRYTYRGLVILFCISLLTETSIMAAGYFIEPGGTVARLGDDASLLTLLLLAAVVLGSLFCRWPWALLRAAGAIALWFVMLTVGINVWPYTRDSFFRSRQPQFQALADAAISSGRITWFWEGPDEIQDLNGSQVAVSPDAHSGLLRPDSLVALDSVLRRDGIDRAQYEAFRRQLRSLHVKHFQADSEVVFLGERDAGFAYVRRDPTSLQVGDTLDGWRGPARITHKFTDHWYYLAR
jgi:hypothetical protein